MSQDIKPEIRDLADKIKVGLSVGDNGVVVTPKDFYAQFLPDGVTPKMVNEVSAARTNIIAAESLALGEVANEAFKKDKKLNSVSVKTAFGDGRVADHISIQVDRSKNSRNPQTGVETTNYNVLTQKFVASGTKSSSSTMKAISTHLRALGAEANG